MALPSRQLTKGQRASVENRTLSIWKRINGIMGKNAEEGAERGPYASQFADQEVESIKTIKLGEVEYTILVCARRAEVSS